MLPITLNPSPIIFTFMVMFGVLVHDMNIDKATKVAFVPPAALASTASANAVSIDNVISRSEHTHVERASIGAYSSTMPKTQPPRDDNHRYIQTKKQFMGGGDDRTSIWPSI